MQLERLMHLFDPVARARGAQYARQGRVFLIEVDAEVFSAVVKGMRSYDVDFELTEGGADMSCTCPHFADQGPCKHLWAGLLKARDALDNPDEWAREALVVPRAFEDEFPPDTRPLAPDRREKAPPSNWQVVLHRIRDTTRAVPDRWAPSTRISYHLLKQATLRSGSTALALNASRPCKDDTGWTQPKPFNITPEEVELLPDETDRHALATLRGAGGGPDLLQHDTRRNASTYRLTGVLTDLLLPLLARAGRLVLEDELAGTLQTIQLDEAAAWQFSLQVRADATTREYVTTGVLHRGACQMPLAEPALLLTHGWMVARAHLVRLECSGSFGWLSALRRDPELRVPFDESQEWLPRFLESPRPPTKMPEALEFVTETAPPEPQLSLYRNRIQQRSSALGAVLRFRYGNRCIASDAPEQTLYDVDRRKACVRDRGAEKAYREALFALPLRTPRETWDDAFPFRVDAVIQAKHLPHVVATLLAQDWHVEMEDAPYKRSSSFNLQVSGETDWFDLEGYAEFGDEKVAMPAILQAARDGTRMVKLRSGATGMLPQEWLNRLRLLTTMGSRKDQPLRFARSQAFLLDALLSQQPGVVWDEASRRVRDELRSFDGIEAGREADTFRGVLREYQREGLGWLAFLQRFGFGGCLADDMGLGKTVQALAWLQQRHREGYGPFLVVAPSSVVTNWMDEAERFVPELPRIHHTGQDRSRDPRKLATAGLVVTSYAILRRDIEWLKDVRFDYAILDEAQAIKNPQTATAKSARLLNATHRLAMSGTPIENHLGELWSLFEFINPGMLGSGTVFEKALTTGRLDMGEDTRELLRKAIRPFVLRRTKEQVAPELPDKQEETIFCELPPSQRKIYDELRDYYRRSLKQKVADNGLGRSKIIVLEALLRLRQVACHPALVDAKYKRKPSAKLDLLLQQVEDVTTEGHKVLVFSQFTTLLGIVRERLVSRRITHEYLDGSTRDRGARVKRFQEDPACPVFLISLKAGGVGLNLTAADYVILLDPWWNPAVEAQAIDRTHRIGQTRKVFAYRLVAKDTVEERILQLQDKKRDLADSIIKADDSLIRSLTPADLEHLLS